MGSGRCKPTDLGAWSDFYCVPLVSGSLENSPDNAVLFGMWLRLEGQLFTEKSS